MSPELTLAIEGVKVAIGLFNTIKENAVRNKELTPEQEAELDAQIAALTGKPHWKVE